MYAVILTGGKQYSVKVGDSIFVEKLNAEADSEVTFEKVLAVGEEGAVKVGAPVVEGATVVGKVIKNGKGKKLMYVVNLCTEFNRLCFLASYDRTYVMTVDADDAVLTFLPSNSSFSCTRTFLIMERRF